MKYRLLCYMIVGVLVFTVDGLGQNTWVKTFGGSGIPGSGVSITKDFDGNIVSTGYTYSSNGDFIDSSKGNSNIFILKLDSNGYTKWIKVLGGNKSDEGNCITVTPDSCYLVTGFTFSIDGDFSNRQDSSRDIILVKLDKNGHILWKRTYGGKGDDRGVSVITSTNGNIYLLGSTNSQEGEFTNNEKKYGSVRIIIKLDSNGNIKWKKNIEDLVLNNDGSYLTVLSDESIVITGYVESNEFMDDIVVKRYRNDGTLIWEKIFSGDVEDYGRSVTSNNNNDIYVTGSTRSIGKFFDGMNIKHKKYDEWGISSDTDVFLIKLDSNGRLKFKKTYGGSKWDEGFGIKCTNDGNVVLTGRTSSNDGMFKKSNIGGYDIFVMKVDSKGKVISKNVIGGKDGESSNSIDVFDNSSIILTGWTNSTDGIFGNNKKGIFVLKLDINEEFNHKK